MHQGSLNEVPLDDVADVQLMEGYGEVFLERAFFPETAAQAMENRQRFW
jgi:hypothetical protein